MKVSLAICSAALLTMAAVAVAADTKESPKAGADKGSVLPENYACNVCHTKGGELWSQETPVVTEQDLQDDVHWQIGLRCHDCHGGKSLIEEHVDHRTDESFRAVASPKDIPGFCGRCHSDIHYMRRYNPSARTDQEAEYWTSGHGRRLKESAEGANAKPDEGVATCSHCHGHHKILRAKDQRSPVYPTRVAETCSVCHSDAKRMEGRKYHDKPLPTDQLALWHDSVHGQALLKKGDLSAPTCNDCHGNHGAMPPGVDSVANACGTCHGKVAKLFAETRMKHRFEEVGLPGCATCHTNHRTVHPTDAMLGMTGSALCLDCHTPEKEQHGATLTGREVAAKMRNGLESLKQQIAEAEATLQDADRLGMEVRGPRFDLRQAADALTNARSLVHTFALTPFEEATREGQRVVSEVKDRAVAALKEHTRRRVWLAGSLIPLFVVIGLLIAYIRRMPLPAE